MGVRPASVLLTLTALTVTGFVQDQREKNMKQIEDYIGTWDMRVTVLEPKDFKGVEAKGTVKVAWTLDHTALDFEANSTFSGAIAEKHATSAKGVVTYNEAAPYDKRGYTGFFSWSEDGRMLSLSGKFVNGKLVFDGLVMGEGIGDLRIKASGDHSRKKIDVFALNHGKETPFLAMVLTRR